MQNYEELLNALNPLQKSIFYALCDNPVLTRDQLQHYLRSHGFFRTSSRSSADRIIRQEKVNMIYLGVPIGSFHGESQIAKNTKKIEKGYFLVLDVNSTDCQKAVLEYDQKIETTSKTKHAFIRAVTTFPHKKERAKPVSIDQPSLFQGATL